jgi:carboxyl-terminal processing protease
LQSALRFWRVSAVVLFSVACFQGVFPVPSARADESKDFKDKALACEKTHDWLGACRWYEKLPRKDRAQPEIRNASQRCLRRYYGVRRSQDAVFKDAVARLNTTEALEVYDQVLVALGSAYVDSTKTDINSLFQQGVQELRYDFEEEVFLQEYLAGARSSSIARFKKTLEEWQTHRVKSRSNAHEELLALIQAARQADLDVKPALAVVIGLEFASGACNALDEYTLFLTPGYYKDIQAVLQGKVVSIGVDLGVSEDQRVEIVRVYPKSPAEEAGLAPHDRILRIDRDVNLAPDQAAEKLRGDAGSIVELELQTPGQMTSHLLKVQRRAVYLPSVMEPRLLALQTDMETIPVGLIQINHFQDSTVQDVKEALAQLQSAGVKALILDLRGNPGGAFLAGVQVAELFLNEGVIVYSESPLDDFNKPFKVEGKNPVQMPVVVLVNRDTASAAEVVAGALKDHRPGTTLIVGQTTFGKGSIQGVIPLDKAPLDKIPGGIRITVAKLFSPGKHLPYTGRGVTPDILVEQDGDAVMNAGYQAVMQLLKPGEMMH